MEFNLILETLYKKNANIYYIAFTSYNSSDLSSSTPLKITANAPDTTPPVITVTSGTDTVEQGSTWTDAGATADGGEAVTVSGMSKETTEGLNFGIKSSAVENFLRSNNINVNISSTKFSMNDDKVNQLLEETTVYTFCEIK